jgi:hypothetical protein
MFDKTKLIASLVVALLGGALLASPASAQVVSIFGGGAANVGVGAGGGGGTGMAPAGGGPGTSGGTPFGRQDSSALTTGPTGPIASSALTVVPQNKK